jgi:hypothetical protein
LDSVNNIAQSSQTFNKQVVNGLVSVSRQTSDGDVTKYTFDVDTSDDKYSVRNLRFVVEDETDDTTIIA